MFVRAVLLATLLVIPLASAAHPVEFDPASLAKEGAEIVVFVDVAGKYEGIGTIDRRGEDNSMEHTNAWRGSYAWSATAFLTALEAPDAAGWTHAGRAWANTTMAYDERGHGLNRHSIGEEYEWHTTSENSCVGAGIDRAYPRVFARVTDSGTLLVRFENMQWRSTTTIKYECRHVSTGPSGTTETTDHAGPNALVMAPVLRKAASARELTHLDVEMDLIQGRQTFIDTYDGDGAPAGVRDEEHVYCNVEPSGEGESRHCTAFGTLEATVFVDPCEVVKESYGSHLAAVKSMQAPAKGSSESQVRSFQTDLRPKVQALLRDARTLDLVCGGGSADAQVAVAEAVRKLADAWFDVARTHGVSREEIQDALAAERAAQLAGSESTANTLADLDASIARNGAPTRSSATATVKVHSPVALHAWDEQGRHVGWNATKNGIDLEVPNATYNGSAGEAQTLVLPEGVYRVAADELGPGTYALNVSAADTDTLVPMRSQAGGGSTFLLVVDHLGAMPLASARGAFAPGFAGIDAMKSTQAPPSSGSTAGGPAPGPAAKDAPLGAWLVLVALVAALAIARRR